MLSTLCDIAVPIFYITNDITKGLGLEKLLPNYYLVCIDDHPIIDLLSKTGVNVFCLERKIGKKNVVYRNSGKLLAHCLVAEYIKDKACGQTPWILYFKPSAKIDLICEKRGYKKIGNNAELNRIFEDKLSFYQLCQKLGLPIPPGEIANLSKINFGELEQQYDRPLVIQFGRGWAGSTTYFIDSKENLDEFKKIMRRRSVKITKYVEGKTILNNCCVTEDEVLVSPPAEQITAVSGFTAQKGGTCGRVWPVKIDDKRYKDIKILSKKIGEEMRRRGYLGYFGLDFLIEEKTGKIYLSECNARLTASVPFYSKLEIKEERMPLVGYHVLTFLGQSYQATKLPSYQAEGSEIVVRNNKDKPILIKKDFKPGIYRLKRGKLVFIRQAYDIEGIKKEGDFFLTAAAKGRIVSSEMEVIRLNSLKNLLDEDGKPEKWVVEMLLKVKERIIN